MPERLRGVFTTRRYTNTRLPLPLPMSARRQGLRSATTSDLVTPQVRLATYCSCAFSVAGPVCCNGLPDYLKSPDLSFDCFKRQLKTLFSALCILFRIVLL